MKKLLSILLIVALLIAAQYFGIIDIPSLGDVVQRSEYTAISDLESLRDHMHEQVENGNLSFSFRYTGSDDLSAELLARLSSGCSIHYSYQGNVYHVTVTQYPGDRVVQAYRSGDTSDLTPGELQVLEKAEDILADITAQTGDPWEQERLIHDQLISRITYYTEDVEAINGPEGIPRFLTVEGALLDGKANCQGYVDAFYTLASMAGFQVGRISVVDPEGPHMANTILLDGKWYIVDVTHDDYDEEGIVSYRLFNVGTDVARSAYTWSAEMEYHPITAQTDQQSYYERYDTAFDDLSDLAEAAVDGWDDRGITEFNGMVKGCTAPEQIEQLLYDALTETGRATRYQYWYSDTDSGVYYTIAIQ